MPESTPRTELIDRLVLCFIRFRKGLIQRQSNHPQSLTPAQSEALMTIGHAEHLTASQLAEQLSVTPGAVTQFIEVLEAHCLVVKSSDAQDRRQTDLCLSKDGQAYLETMKQQKQQFFAEVLNDLSDQELRQLTELMEKVADSVHHHQQRSTN